MKIFKFFIFILIFNISNLKEVEEDGIGRILYYVCMFALLSSLLGSCGIHLTEKTK